MVRRFYLQYLAILCLILVACSLVEPDRPLPTLAPTAAPLPTVGDVLGQGPDTPAAALPTEVVPTASPTSPPTATGVATDVGTADSIGARASATASLSAAADLEPTPVVGTAEQSPPTVTPSSTLTSAPTFTETPTETPTLEPTSTRPPTPVGFPRPPEVVWPTLTPHEGPAATSPRHGVAVALGGAPQGTYGDGAYSWTYSWTPYVPPVLGSVQHVPMLAGSTRQELPAVDVIVELDGYNDHNYWLVFNECEHQGQCNATPAEAAQYFHDRVVDLLFTQGGDPDADIIVGGVNAHPCGILWLKNFVDYYEVTYGPLPRAGWHFHLYPEMRPSGWPGSCNGGWGFDDTLFPNADAAFNLWREHAYNALAFVQEYGGPDDEIWFTEVGCLNNGFHQVQGPICQGEGFVQAYAGRILSWLNGEGRWVSRYAWFTNYDRKYWITTHLIADAPTGEQWQYSSLGYWYSQIVPAAAASLPWP